MEDVPNEAIDKFIKFLDLWDDEEYISVDELKAELQNLKK